jgi:hypothetical protein
MLDVCDFTVNPATPELGEFGICQVRFGKAMRGSPAKRRMVATVMPWAARAGAVPGRGVAAVWLPRPSGDLADRAGRQDLGSPGRRQVRAVQGAGRPAAGAVGALPAALVCYRIWSRTGRPAVRAAAGPGMCGRRPPRPTPRWARTRATGCCVLRCRGPTMRTAAEGTAGDDTQDRIRVASAQAHGRARHLRHHRPAAAASGAGSQPVARAGLPAPRTPERLSLTHSGRVVRHPGMRPG